MLSFIYHILKVLVLLLLPFIVLIRTATYLHISYAVSPWNTLVMAAVLTSAIMFIYFSIFYGQITGRFGNFNAVKRRALMSSLFVIIYIVHGILFFSNSNFKNKALSKEVKQLHPILRLSLSTVIHLDNKFIITDASRVPEDYQSMGLPTNSSSLHYRQNSTTYVHAVDIRTKGRNEIKNALITSYFKLMGFNTLRHMGTEDHLHVSLLSHDLPYAK